jgi:transketolase
MLKQYKIFSDAIKFLSLDMINQANSGHSGIVCGISDILSVLFNKHIIFNPKDPKWLARDYFILSAGHGSAALYSALYLSGYDISLDDIKNFRQINSKATGHPESHLIDCVECTTGPLGQGLANAVGFAYGLKLLSKRFNIFDNKVYCLVGDGCLMEGISQEALSFASVNNLDNLIVIFDNNSITIDGSTNLSTQENQILRAKALQFNTFEIDGHNYDQIDAAIKNAKLSERPSFISAKTIIGKGTSKAGSEKAHGSVIDSKEIIEMKKNADYPLEKFSISDKISIKEIWERNKDYYNKWQDSYNNHIFKKELERFQENDLHQVLSILNNAQEDAFRYKKQEATRQSSCYILEIIKKNSVNIIGGSADLSKSVLTQTTNSIPIDFTKNSNGIEYNNFGNYIYYGIREHAMAAIANSLASLGFVPYIGTFLVFSDYLRPALRLSCLSNLAVWFIFSHDSIFLGEDGPTHQPVEHLTSLRIIPNMYVFRPCDLFETIECYKQMIKRKGPSSLILTRQELPQIARENSNNIDKGMYEIYITCKNVSVDFVIIASGSEVCLAIDVANILYKEKNSCIKVISAYCLEIFEKQNQKYKDSILKEQKAQYVAIEAGSKLSMSFYAKTVFSVEEFGLSAKKEDIINQFEFNAQNIANKIIKNLY